MYMLFYLDFLFLGNLINLSFYISMILFILGRYHKRSLTNWTLFILANSLTFQFITDMGDCETSDAHSTVVNAILIQ